MVDALSRKLTTGKNEGNISRIHPSSGVEAINHALFVDDTLLLGGDSFKMKRDFTELCTIFVLFHGLLLTIVRVSGMAGM